MVDEFEAISGWPMAQAQELYDWLRSVLVPAGPLPLSPRSAHLEDNKTSGKQAGLVTG